MDKDTLAKKLAALSADGETFENGLRVISDGTEPAILTAILSEVDMTVLPRKLTFAMDGSEITLVAGGRRLRGLVKASKDIKGVTGVLGNRLRFAQHSGSVHIACRKTDRRKRRTRRHGRPDRGRVNRRISGQRLGCVGFCRTDNRHDKVHSRLRITGNRMGDPV